MTLLADLTVQASVLLLGALLAVAMAKRRSAALRHWLLSVAIVCTLAAPLLGRIVPAWALPRSTPATAAGSAAPLTSTPSPLVGAAAVDSAATRHGATRGQTARRWIVAIWLAGVGVNLFVLCVGLARLAWISSRAEWLVDRTWRAAAEDIGLRYAHFPPVRLLHSAHPALVVTWGVIHPKILLPRTAPGWPAARIHVVLAHELAHIRRRDWLPQIAAELLRSLHWFNPIVRIVCARLREESEQACDDTVVSMGVPGEEYASHLLELARDAVSFRTSWSPALAIARPSTLEGRIRAMLNARLNRTPLTPRLGAATALFCAAATLPVAGFTTMPEPPPPAAAVDAHATLAPAVKVVRFSVLNRGNQRSGQFTPASSTGAVVGDTLAQTAFASFAGQLADPSGGLLPGVKLRLSNRQSGAIQEVRSDRRGRFEFVGLPAGDYALDAVLAGFSNFREAVSLTAGQAAEQTITMEIGSIEETLMVTEGDAYPPDYGTQTHVARGRPGGENCSAPVAGGIGGNLKAPSRVVNVRPVYPVGSREAKIEGTVTLRGRITTSGFVTDVRTLDAPSADLASAAGDAISGWRFEPTLLNCQPIDTTITVRVKFQLAH